MITAIADTAPHVAIVADVVKPTAATPRIVPTVSQPVRLGWGAWLEQGLVHETKMIEAGINAGLEIIEGMTPMGWAIKLFASRATVNGLIEQGIKVLGTFLDPLAVTTDAADHPVFAYVLNMFNDMFPNTVTALGPKLEELIKEELAKFGITV